MCIRDSLEIQGPLFLIASRPAQAGPAVLEVPLPDEAGGWETLDLYTWTEEAWEWLGGRMEPDRGVLVARVDRLPPLVALMQTYPVVPRHRHGAPR